MMTPVYAAVTRYARCAAVAAAAIAILLMAACGGGGTSGEQAPTTLSVIDVGANVAIESGASLPGLSKIAIAGNGDNASDISVSFRSAQDPPQPLIRDLASPGEFWLPIVLARTAGTLSISAANRATVAMPLTLMPFAAPDAAGVATRNFLQDSLSNANAAVRDVLAGPTLPDLLQALNATMALTQLELDWVTDAMQNGSAIMATHKDGTAVRMTTADLGALDQMVLHTEALRTGQGAARPAARLSPWMTIMNFMMASAYAQTSDSAAFISGARATGDALGLAANMVPGLAAAGASAFRAAANAQVMALNLAGLYAAHYGNALATMQTLPNLSFPEPVDDVQIAVSALFAGVVNEIVLPELDNLAQDSAIGLVRKFTAKADNAAVENIVMDQAIIFKTRSAGIRLCPAGTLPVPDPEADFISCASL